ncbi:MAG: ATP-binding protein [Thermodesulfobacteriota bacterium]
MQSHQNDKAPLSGALENIRRPPLLFAALALAGAYNCARGAYLLAWPGSHERFYTGLAGLLLLALGLVALACLMDVRRHRPVAAALAVYLLAEALFLSLSSGPLSLLRLTAGEDVAVALFLLAAATRIPDRQGCGEEAKTLLPPPEPDGRRHAPVPEPKPSPRTPAPEKSTFQELRNAVGNPQSAAFAGRKDVSAHGILEPGTEGGGDFFRCFFLSRDLLCFYVGNVDAQGIPAALRMAAAAALLRAGAGRSVSPAEILSFATEELARDDNQRFGVGLFLGVLDAATGELVYANAGAPPAFLVRKNGHIEHLDVRHGPMLGVVRKMAYRESRAALSHGDLVLVKSKDARDVSENPEDFLSGALGGSAEAAARFALSSGGEEAAGKRHAKDRTALAVLFSGRPEDAGSYAFEFSIANRLEEIEKAKEHWEDFADLHGLPRTVRRQMAVVMDELLNNIISYAYEDGLAHEIAIRLLLSPEMLTAVIADDGKAFNPLELPSPDADAFAGMPDKEGGMGIHLVKNVMDSVSYERRDGENILTLSKALKKEAEE